MMGCGVADGVARSSAGCVLVDGLRGCRWVARRSTRLAGLLIGCAPVNETGEVADEFRAGQRLAVKRYRPSISKFQPASP